MKKIDFTKYTIETDKFPKDFTGFNFIVMSDLHSNSYGINLHEVNSMIKKASPDAILMAVGVYPGMTTPMLDEMIKKIKEAVQ